MDRTSDALDIMLVESRPGAAREAIAELTAAGHRVHRCHDRDAESSFPCAGVLDHGSCPIDRGVDVALLVRREGTTDPTTWEHGVSCALRAGVPVVEDGPAESDPYAAWISRRVDGSVTSAVELAAEEAFDPLIRAIHERTRRLVESARVEPGALTWVVESRGHGLHVQATGPRLTRQLEQALAVRVLDALQGTGHTYGQVDVSFAVAEPVASSVGFPGS